MTDPNEVEHIASEARKLMAMVEPTLPDIHASTPKGVSFVLRQLLDHLSRAIDARDVPLMTGYILAVYGMAKTIATQRSKQQIGPIIAEVIGAIAQAMADDDTEEDQEDDDTKPIEPPTFTKPTLN